MKKYILATIAFWLISTANATTVNPPRKVAEFEVSDPCRPATPCFIMGSEVQKNGNIAILNVFLRIGLDAKRFSVEFNTKEVSGTPHMTLTQVEDEMLENLPLSTFDLPSISLKVNHLGDLNGYFCQISSPKEGWTFAQTETHCANVVEFKTHDNKRGFCSIGHEIVNEQGEDGRFFTFLGLSIRGHCFLQM